MRAKTRPSRQRSSELLVVCDWPDPCSWAEYVRDQRDADRRWERHARQRQIDDLEWAVGDECVVLDGRVVWTISRFFGKDDRIADLVRPGWTAATSAPVRHLRPVGGL